MSLWHVIVAMIYGSIKMQMEKTVERKKREKERKVAGETKKFNCSAMESEKRVSVFRKRVVEFLLLSPLTLYSSDRGNLCGFHVRLL